MSFRSKFGTLLLGFCLLTGPSTAESPKQQNDHLSYYTYYKTQSGESVSAVASKFGLAKSSLLKMNPQLGSADSQLPAGSLLCVPKAGTSAPASKTAKKSKPKMEVAKVSKKTSSRKKRRRKRKKREEPDEAEWDRLAELATKGSPDETVVVRPKAAAPSKLVRPNGEVVWIPAAAAKPAPKPKKRRKSRVRLSSRKGKAIHGVLKTCRSYMGTPYVWGGELPGGFDCSGYVQYVFAKHGYKLPRTADIQFNVGKKVKRGDEKPGDLVFFETYAPGASHVGVYLGRGYFIHASSSRGVTVERLATDFFAQRYLGAKRNAF